MRSGAKRAPLAETIEHRVLEDPDNGRLGLGS
jgi:hypothetical protein